MKAIRFLFIVRQHLLHRLDLYVFIIDSVVFITNAYANPKPNLINVLT